MLDGDISSLPRAERRRYEREVNKEYKEKMKGMTKKQKARFRKQKLKKIAQERALKKLKRMALKKRGCPVRR